MPRVKSTILRLLSGMEVNASGCMLWTRADSGNGYGRMSINGKNRGTHLISYEIFVGPIPNNMLLDHTCRNRACFNPYHLHPRTSRDNTLLGIGPSAMNARKTECVRGHDLNGPDAKVVTRKGRRTRVCVACIKIRSKKK